MHVGWQRLALSKVEEDHAATADVQQQVARVRVSVELPEGCKGGVKMGTHLRHRLAAGTPPPKARSE